MGEKSNQVGRAVSMAARVLTSLLWIGVGVIGVSIGQPLAALAAGVYLVYLWAFNGRWLVF